MELHRWIWTGRVGLPRQPSYKSALPYPDGKLYATDLETDSEGEVMRFPKIRSACMAVVTLGCPLAISAAFAQMPASSGSMPGMEMSAVSGSQGDTPSTAAFQAADHAMMSGMSGVAYTGNADRDFVAHMIPHHRGAVGMAEVELKYGKDAKLRALAKDIIEAQDKEIAFMNQWLAAHPQKK